MQNEHLNIDFSIPRYNKKNVFMKNKCYPVDCNFLNMGVNADFFLAAFISG